MLQGMLVIVDPIFILFSYFIQVNKRGQIVSENQYRLNMARKEHKKHVKDLLAQAIVHKTLDIERNRQVEIKCKLEEISKLELVRRVRVCIV